MSPEFITIQLSQNGETWTAVALDRIGCPTHGASGSTRAEALMELGLILEVKP